MRALFLQSARKVLIDRGDSWGNLRLCPGLVHRSFGHQCDALFSLVDFFSIP